MHFLGQEVTTPFMEYIYLFPFLGVTNNAKQVSLTLDIIK